MGRLLLFYAPVGMCRGRHGRNNAEGSIANTSKTCPSCRTLCCVFDACLHIDLTSPGESEPTMQGRKKKVYAYLPHINSLPARLRAKFGLVL